MYPLGYSTYIKEINFSDIYVENIERITFLGINYSTKAIFNSTALCGFFGKKDFQQLFLLKRW